MIKFLKNIYCYCVGRKQVSKKIEEPLKEEIFIVCLSNKTVLEVKTSNVFINKMRCLEFYSGSYVSEEECFLSFNSGIWESVRKKDKDININIMLNSKFN